MPENSRGLKPSELLRRSVNAVKPTIGDAVLIGEEQRARILDRTANGQDLHGNTFHPYSTNGPYYLYPSVHLGKSPDAIKTRKNAVRHLLNITMEVHDNLLGTKHEMASVGGVKTQRGLSIRFESYADYKASIGRFGVDLYGLRAPHMLQAIQIKVGGGTGTKGDTRSAIATTMAIGVYDKPAARATGHNEGTRFLPKREFIGASPQDISKMSTTLLRRARQRLDKK